jgi:hypothetical protein
MTEDNEHPGHSEQTISELLSAELAATHMTRPAEQITARATVLRRRRATLSAALAVLALGALGSTGALLLSSPTPQRIVPVTSDTAPATPGQASATRAPTTAATARSSSATPGSKISSTVPPTSDTRSTVTTATTASTS